MQAFYLDTQMLKSPSILRITGEDLVAPTPLTQILDRDGADEPASAVPADAHRPGHSFDIVDIEDVRGAIGQELSELDIGLLFEELPDAGESRIVLASQFVQDRLVQGVLLELANAEGDFSLWVFHLTQEVLFEVVSDRGDLHLFAVRGEVLIG